MAEAVAPEGVRFFVAVLAATEADLARAGECLVREWGTPDLTADPLRFSFTQYYAPELGEAPWRGFFAFPGRFDPGRLAERKLRTNELEVELAAGSTWSRPINLDPGYLAPDKLVLASCKNFSHRIYLADGVYAEVTLLYRHDRFEPLEWTFPDYGSGVYDPFFLELRRRLMRERRQ